MTTYTAYRLDPTTRELSCRENLNNQDEVNEWLGRKRFFLVVVFEDSTGKAKQGMRIDDQAWYIWSRYNA